MFLPSNIQSILQVDWLFLVIVLLFATVVAHAFFPARTEAYFHRLLGRAPPAATAVAKADGKKIK